MMKNGNKSGECVHPPFSWLEELAHHPFLFVVFSISLSADFPFFFLFFIYVSTTLLCIFARHSRKKKKKNNRGAFLHFKTISLLSFSFSFHLQ